MGFLFADGNGYLPELHGGVQSSRDHLLQQIRSKEQEAAKEAWWRVASEARCSGIPVLGSRRGCLPEAIGGGGIVLDCEQPLDAWVAALGRLWLSGTFRRGAPQCGGADARSATSICNVPGVAQSSRYEDARKRDRRMIQFRLEGGAARALQQRQI
jgi:hypothetical protein